MLTAGFGNEVFEADITVTLAGYKRGLYFGSGYASAGEIVKEGIGIKENFIDEYETSDYLIEPEDALYSLPSKKKNAHKYSNGKVFTIAGSGKLFGAALFASKSVFAVGAGASVLAFPAVLRNLIAPSIDEVILESYGSSEDHLTNELASSFKTRLEWADVISIGSGIGRDDTILLKL